MISVLMATLLVNAEPASQSTSAEKKTCRSEPQVGSRVRKNRTCRTAAEWKQFEADRAQLRRDLVNSTHQNNNQGSVR